MSLTKEVWSLYFYQFKDNWYWGSYDPVLAYMIVFRAKPIQLNRVYYSRGQVFQLYRIHAGSYNESGMMICINNVHTSLNPVALNYYRQIDPKYMADLENKHAEMRQQFQRYFRNRLLEYAARGKYFVPFSKGETKFP